MNKCDPADTGYCGQVKSKGNCLNSYGVKILMMKVMMVTMVMMIMPSWSRGVNSQLKSKTMHGNMLINYTVEKCMPAA